VNPRFYSAPIHAVEMPLSVDGVGCFTVVPPAPISARAASAARFKVECSTTWIFGWPLGPSCDSGIAVLGQASSPDLAGLRSS
jgi:hypothetical protein